MVRDTSGGGIDDDEQSKVEHRQFAPAPLSQNNSKPLPQTAAMTKPNMVGGKAVLPVSIKPMKVVKKKF